jgi:hypothetical protein
MKARTITLALALAMAATAPAWAVNKCTGADGKVVFQDAPCEGEGEKLRIMGAGQGDPTSQGAVYWQREAEKNRRASQMQRAIAAREVVIGMTAEEVVASWGRPTKVNTTITGGSKTEQWVYRRGGVAAQYIYLHNGAVRSMQDSQ